jgi:hypothetical protein
MNFPSVEKPSWLKWLIPIVSVLILAPTLYGFLHAPQGSRYIGFEYNTDDHMVYAAWMRQAMDGRLLMDNRFTTDPQPSLTFNLYFLLLGWLAKAIGIAWAATAGRVIFSGVFLLLAGRLIGRLGFAPRWANVALLFTVFGGGLGFLFWQMFGVSISKPLPQIATDLLNGQLPIDVWQPEGFIFPSMLTNGLFMVSLCLILSVYECFLSAKADWRAVPLGFFSLGALMNIHSYDVLTIAFVMLGFVSAAWKMKGLTLGWIFRAAVIVSGVALPALWFVHVLQVDKVFQSRAATETYSPNYRAVLFGYLPLIGLGLYGAFVKAKTEGGRKMRNRRLAAVGLLTLLILGLGLAANANTPGYFLNFGGWGVCFVIAVVAACLWAEENAVWSLLFSWAAVGMVAIYFPQLFQRKLTMGLSVPWALLAAFGLQDAIQKAPASSRKLYASAVGLVVCASSFLWLARDFAFINQNVSNTTRHPVYLDADLSKIVSILNERRGRKVVLALPGAGTPSVGPDGRQIVDSFGPPALPDISPILSGLTGAYTYAGHWSETPDYGQRAGTMYRFFLKSPFGSVRAVMSPAEREALVSSTGANYAVIPTSEEGLPLVSAAELGKTIFAGDDWTLVGLDPQSR